MGRRGNGCREGHCWKSPKKDSPWESSSLSPKNQVLVPSSPSCLVKKSLIGTFSSSYTKKSLETNTPETDVIVCTLPRPSTLAHVVDVQQFIRSHIARTIYTAVPLLLDFLKRRRANRKVNILDMPSTRFIGERVVVVLVVRTSGTYCTRKKATRCMFCVTVSSYRTC